MGEPQNKDCELLAVRPIQGLEPAVPEHFILEADYLKGESVLKPINQSSDSNVKTKLWGYFCCPM